MGLLNRMLGKKKITPSGPGPTNTTSLVFTDTVVRDHEHDLTTTSEKRHDVVDGLADLLGEPMIRWCVRDAQATARRVRVLVNDEPATLARWESALPKHILARPEDEGKDPALAIIPVDTTTSRIEQALTVLDQVAPDEYVQLLDARMPSIGPDSLLLFAERLGKHDVVAFHLDGWWIAEPSLWRREALDSACRRAHEAGHRDIGTLMDDVDARPLDEGFLDAILADAEDLRAIVDGGGLTEATRRVRARRQAPT